MTDKKFNCYKCKYRGNVPGSCHSSCHHPSLNGISDNPLIGIINILASARNESGLVLSSDKLNIQANPHGIKSGWFNFPSDFDPVWLENCDGFEQKDKDV